MKFRFHFSYCSILIVGRSFISHQYIQCTHVYVRSRYECCTYMNNMSVSVVDINTNIIATLTTIHCTYLVFRPCLRLYLKSRDCRLTFVGGGCHLLTAYNRKDMDFPQTLTITLHVHTLVTQAFTYPDVKGQLDHYNNSFSIKGDTRGHLLRRVYSIATYCKRTIYAVLVMYNVGQITIDFCSYSQELAIFTIYNGCIKIIMQIYVSVYSQ